MHMEENIVDTKIHKLKELIQIERKLHELYSFETCIIASLFFYLFILYTL